MNRVEIEKKYLIEKLPADLEQYDSLEIEQCYLCTNPVIRIRKKDNSYILTYKKRVPTSEKLCIAEEIELPLTDDAYYHLREKRDGRCLTKTRYIIPYENRWTIELDIFHGGEEGFCLAEVEFSSSEESSAFHKPSWFGKDVSGDFHYTNFYLSQK